eukprot:scaffold408_cov347-Pavlova_lutheri.AAC.20
MHIALATALYIRFLLDQKKPTPAPLRTSKCSTHINIEVPIATAIATDPTNLGMNTSGPESCFTELLLPIWKDANHIRQQVHPGSTRSRETTVPSIRERRKRRVSSLGWDRSINTVLTAWRDGVEPDGRAPWARQRDGRMEMAGGCVGTTDSWWDRMNTAHGDADATCARTIGKSLGDSMAGEFGRDTPDSQALAIAIDPCSPTTKGRKTVFIDDTLDATTLASQGRDGRVWMGWWTTIQRRGSRFPPYPKGDHSSRSPVPIAIPKGEVEDTQGWEWMRNRTTKG